MIEVRGLTKRYGAKVAVDDLTFGIEPGKVTGFLGPNGAGKTTLVRLVSGDLAAQAGTVSSSGGLGVMRQFVGGIRDTSTVRDLLLSIAAPRVRAAAERLDAIGFGDEHPVAPNDTDEGRQRNRRIEAKEL